MSAFMTFEVKLIFMQISSIMTAFINSFDKIYTKNQEIFYKLKNKSLMWPYMTSQVILNLPILEFISSFGMIRFKKKIYWRKSGFLDKKVVIYQIK